MKYLSTLVLLLLMCSFALGQETNTFLQLKTENTSLETGQRYTVNIEIQNVSELWAADLEFRYNPEQLYIIGTEAGSPLEIDDFLIGGDTIFNTVNENTGLLRYAFSIFSPANPVSGTGIIGSFEIVPLLAGTSQISLSRGEVSSVEFILDESGQRVGGEAIELAFLPILLELQITGDPATPPSEATATPSPSPTFDPALLGQEVTEEAATELVNITAAPSTPTTNIETSLEESSNTDNLLCIGIGLVIVAAFGLIALFVLSRRKK